MDDDKREEQVPALEEQGDTTETTEPSPEELKAEVEKERKARKDQELRAKAAEEKLKKLEADKNEKKPEATPGFSIKDVLALQEAKVTLEDYDEVERVSRILGKSIPETLRDDTMQTILSRRIEHRRTAAATQTGKAGRGAEKVTDSDILSKAERTGEIPDSSEGMNSLWRARQARRFPSARK